MEQWVAENIVWVITAAFGAGGFYWAMRNMAGRFDQHEDRMAQRFDEHEARLEKRFDRLDHNDAEHDRSIADLQARMARQEERTAVLSEMRGQISDIWKRLHEGKI